jgi:hypothetical protein
VSAKGKTYLVSAAHSLLGIHHANEPNPRLKKPTVFHLFMNKVHSKIVERIPIDLAGSILDVDSSYFTYNPDFYCVPVTIPSGYEIHTINSFFSKNGTNYDKAVRAIMYGYPENSDLDTCNGVLLQTDTYLQPVHPVENLSESDISLHVIDGVYGKGDSGAPLFLQLNNSKIIFGGIYIAAYDQHVIFIRPEWLFDFVRKL